MAERAGKEMDDLIRAGAIRMAPADPEIAALGKIAAGMEELEPEAQARVLRWGLRQVRAAR